MAFTNNNRYDHSVTGIAATLHSFAIGTLQADPELMYSLYAWLWWRISGGWINRPPLDFDEAALRLCVIVLVECEEKFGWPPLAEPPQGA
jgi:hypothetical protein